MKKEQVAGLEQTKQEGAEPPIEPIVQPELETLHSFEQLQMKNNQLFHCEEKQNSNTE